MRLPNVASLRLTVGPLFAPENVEELLGAPPSDTSFGSEPVPPPWQANIEQLWFRFNPYVAERSYYTFLKGKYFDTTATTLASWPDGAAPRLRRVALEQDLPPTHGQTKKSVPAFGLAQLDAALDEIAPQPTRVTRAEGKMDFAQPIVLFKLFCLTTLAVSPVGRQLEHLVLRLPRRNLLVALTAFADPAAHPFNALTHLDLSTSHVPSDDLRLPALLRLMYRLEHLVLDRCSGLIGPREADTEPALITLRWLAKCCGGNGLGRAEEAHRAWRRLIKERPTGVPAPGPAVDVRTGAPAKEKRKGGRSGYAMAPRSLGTREEAQPVTSSVAPQWKEMPLPVVRDVLVIAPTPKLKSLGLGLFDVPPATEKLWQETFHTSYGSAIDKVAEKIEAGLEQWDLWCRRGKVDQGSCRMVTFRDAVPAGSRWVDWDRAEPDDAFDAFCAQRELVVITPAAAGDILQELRQKRDAFVVCTVPDCSNAAGVPHLSLEAMKGSGKENVQQRAKRERELWEREARERAEWRRPAAEHREGCGHVAGREGWAEPEPEPELV